MKYFLIFFMLLALVFSQNNNEDMHGCQIPEGEEQCCWLNRNGCCQPVGPEQACDDAITPCCKKKVYDETTGLYNYEYSIKY